MNSINLKRSFRNLSAWLFLAGCLLPRGLHAQNDATNSSGALSVRAMLLAPAGSRADLHVVASAKAQGPFLIVAGGLGEKIHPSSRSFFFALPDANAKSGFKTVAPVDLPKGGQDFIVLLEPSQSGYLARVINGDDPAFKLDSIAFYNAADVAIGAVLGSKNVLVKPRELTIAQPEARTELPYFQVALYELKGSGQTLIGSTRWPHRSRSRAYVFLYRDSKSGRIVWEAADEVIAKD